MIVGIIQRVRVPRGSVCGVFRLVLREEGPHEVVLLPVVSLEMRGGGRGRRVASHRGGPRRGGRRHHRIRACRCDESWLKGRFHITSSKK